MNEQTELPWSSMAALIWIGVAFNSDYHLLLRALWFALGFLIVPALHIFIVGLWLAERYEQRFASA